MRLRHHPVVALWLLVFTVCLPIHGVALDEAVAVDLAATDPDTRELLQSMLEAARTNPGSAEARGQLGAAYEMNSFADAALASYVQAEKLDAKSFLWPYSRALLLGCSSITSPACSATRTNYDAALVSMDRALAIDDTYVPAWLWRASWLDELGHPDEAMAAYRCALELGGDKAAASAGLARLLLRRGQANEALARLVSVTANQSNPEIFRLLGRAYQQLNQPEKARIAFARGKDSQSLRWHDPRIAFQDQYFVSYGARLARAEATLVAGDAAVGLAELEKLRLKRPDDPTLLRLIGTAYQQLGQPARARDVLRQGLRIEPDDYLLNLVMAGVYREAGLMERALSYMQRAILAVPTRGDAHYLKGTILMEHGRYDDARAAFDKALQYGVKDPEQLLFMAGTMEVIEKNWDAAAARFEQAIGLNVSYVRAHLALAGTRAEQGRFSDARAALAWAERLAASARELTGMRNHIAKLESAVGGTP